jgi:hypothetical protein
MTFGTTPGVRLSIHLNYVSRRVYLFLTFSLDPPHLHGKSYSGYSQLVLYFPPISIISEYTQIALITRNESERYGSIEMTSRGKGEEEEEEAYSKIIIPDVNHCEILESGIRFRFYQLSELLELYI